MAPVVESVGSYVSSAAATSHDLNLPAGVTAGDLLLAFVSSDGRRTFTMTGWTTLFSDTDNIGGSGTGGNSLHIAYREATGTDPVTVGISSNEDIKGLIYRVSGHEDPGTQAPEVTTNVQSGNTPATTSDPPSLSPTGGSKDYLWFTGVSVDDLDITAAPTNYDTNKTILNTVGTGEAPLGVSWRTNTAASEDPSAWGTWLSETHIGFTLAVHPAAGGGGTLFERSAAISGTGTITVANRVREVERTVAITGAGAVTVANHERDLLRSAAIAGTGTIAVANHERDLLRSAALSGVGSISASAMRELLRSASLAGTGAITIANRVRVLDRSAALTAASAVTVSNYMRELVRSAALTGTGTITVSHMRELLRQAAISGVSSIEVSALVIPPGGTLFERSASMTAASAITVANRVRIVDRSLAISASSAVTVSNYLRVLERAAALAGVGAINVDAFTRELQRSAALSATGAITVADFERELERAAALSAVGAIDIASASVVQPTAGGVILIFDDF